MRIDVLSVGGALGVPVLAAHYHQVAEEVHPAVPSIVPVREFDPDAGEEKRTHHLICRLGGVTPVCLLFHSA